MSGIVLFAALTVLIGAPIAGCLILQRRTERLAGRIRALEAARMMEGHPAWDTALRFRELDPIERDTDQDRYH